MIERHVPAMQVPSIPAQFVSDCGLAEDKEPMNGTGKQAFDIEHNVPPKAQLELDSRGLKRSGLMLHTDLT